MEKTGTSYKEVGFWILAALVVVGGIAIVLPFVPALLWATVLSILTCGIYRRINKRLESIKILQKDGRSETVASLITVLITLFVLCIPFLLVGVGMVVQLSGVATDIANPSVPGQPMSIESAFHQLDVAVKPTSEALGFKDFSAKKWLEDNREQLTRTLQGPVTTFAKQLVFTILTIVIALLTQFFLLRDGYRMKEPALQLMPLAKGRTNELLERIGETVMAVFVGTVLVAVIQGTIIGITYWAVGVPNALLLGVISVMLCIIPLLGAPVVYLPVALVLLTQGNVSGALWVLGVGFLIVSQIDNVLKPFLIGGRVNLHPMLIFFAILGGVLLFGPIGVMAGPMLATILLALVDVVLDKMRAKGESVPDGGFLVDGT